MPSNPEQWGLTARLSRLSVIVKRNSYSYAREKWPYLHLQSRSQQTTQSKKALSGEQDLCRDRL